MMTGSAEFPIYSRERIQLNNLILTRRPVVNVRLDDKIQALSLGQAADETADGGITFSLLCQGAELWIEIQDALFRQLCVPWTGDEELSALPGPLRDAVRNVALQPLLDGLEQALGIAARAVPDSGSRDGLKSHCVGLWSAPVSGPVPLVKMHLGEGAETLLIAALERLPAPPPARDWSGLLLELPVEIGNSTLRSAELKGLKVGDLILLPPGTPVDGSALILRQGERPHASAHLEGRILTVDQLMGR